MSSEFSKREILASLVRGINPDKQPHYDEVYGAKELYDRVETLLKRFCTTNNSGRTLDNNFRASLDLVMSVLTFKTTKSGALYEAHATAQETEKLINCKVYYNESNINKSKKVITDSVTLSKIADDLMSHTTDIYLPLTIQHLHELKMERHYSHMRFLRIGREYDMDYYNYYEFRELIHKWWDYYCSDEKSYTQDCLSWLSDLLRATLRLRYFEPMSLPLDQDDSDFIRWSAAFCVVLEAYHRKFKFTSGVKYILSGDYTIDNYVISITFNESISEPLAQKEIIEQKQLQQPSSSYHEISESKSQVVEACELLESSSLSTTAELTDTNIEANVTQTKEMENFSVDELLEHAKSTARHIQKSKTMESDALAISVKEWKSQIAKASIALIQHSINNPTDATSSQATNIYDIDLRAGYSVLPQRIGGVPTTIDEITKAARDHHEKEMEECKIQCYKISENGDLLPFERKQRSGQNVPLLRQSRSEPVTFVRQLQMSMLPIDMQDSFEERGNSSYQIKCCAHPGCSNKNGIRTDIDHLQLCVEHDSEFKSKLYEWIPPTAKENYEIIKSQAEKDPTGTHNRVYYQFLPQVDRWIKQIDDFIPANINGTEPDTRAVDAWLILQLRPVRQLLMLMKAAIFIYRMHLNQTSEILAAIIGLCITIIGATEVQHAAVNEVVRAMRVAMRGISGIFIHFSIGVLYTLELINSDDAYLAIVLQGLGITAAAIGCTMIASAAASSMIIPGIAVVGAGITCFNMGRNMRQQRIARGEPHFCLVTTHLDLRRARERLWQWIEQ